LGPHPGEHRIGGPPVTLERRDTTPEYLALCCNSAIHSDASAIVNAREPSGRALVGPIGRRATERDPQMMLNPSTSASEIDRGFVEKGHILKRSVASDHRVRRDRPDRA
jgi:hypothetical protein